ncbi:MAG: sulfite exporter TauE/SafE family protein [Gammaproteobacteria bacterium]|nr:sulfite exporter TauE/SafE family protein [Gammaproteobacteria bacterium]
MDTTAATLIAALLMGLFGTVHCVAMCGGIAGALANGLAPEVRQRPGAVFACQLGYNAGRIISYAVAGALVGLLGRLVASAAGLDVARILLQGLAGGFMLLLGLYLTGWWPVLTRLEAHGARLWRHIEPAGRRLLPIRSPQGALPVGMVWGWLPCGLVYSALALAASAGGPLGGALVMLCFGLGTWPSMLASGLFASRVRRLTGPRSRVAAGVLVLLLGVASLGSLGMHLAGTGHAGHPEGAVGAEHVGER